MGLFFQTIIDGLTLGSGYALLALGFALVFNVSGVLNVAHPAFYMLGAYGAAIVLGLSASSVLNGPGGLAVGLVVGVGTAAIAGIALQVAVLRRLRVDNQLAAFIATLGAASALEYGVARVLGPRERFFPDLMGVQMVRLGPVAVSTPQLLTFGVTLAVVATLFWWIRGTNLGREIRAVSENEIAAALIGVRVDRVKLVVLCVGSGIAGLTGVLLGSVYGVITPFMGGALAFRMFVVVLVAGIDSLAGPVVIGFALGLSEAFTVQYVGSVWQQFAGLVGLVAVLLLRPYGIFGRQVRSG